MGLRLKIYLLISSLAITLSVSGKTAHQQPVSNVSREKVITTIFGPVECDSLLIYRLLETKALKRLHAIDQSGPVAYFGLTPAFSRYEHSIGVWALLKYYGANEKEQAAGLMHDVSHTAFSHVTDHLFYEPDMAHSYQDTIHLWYLKAMKVDEVASVFGLTLEDLNPDSLHYRRLEQPLPDLCADRIEYILHTGFLWKKITLAEVHNILKELKFDEGRWYFITLEAARKFSRLSLYFTQNVWGSPWNKAFYEYFKEALKRAIELRLITKDQLHFGYDRQILDILLNSSDIDIQNYMKACRNIHDFYQEVEGKDYHYFFKPKCRAVDPWVKVERGFLRLTELDPSYKKDFEKIKNWCQKGIKIKFTLHLKKKPLE